MVFTIMRDITNLDAKTLLAFDALMEERSVTRAAARMGMTQQGVSGMLNRMRKLFADPLFVREARGISPTPRAEALAPRIKAAIAGLESVFEQEEFDPARAEGTIYLATADYAMSTIIAPLFQQFRRLAPHVRLAVLPFHPATIDDQHRAERVDMAVTIRPLAPANWHTRKLFGERYLGAVRADHPLAASEIDLDAFCNCEHLLVAPYKADFSGVIDVELARLGRSRQIGLSIPSFSVVGAILERTDLMAALPERILRHMNRRLHIFRMPLELSHLDIVTAWPERVDGDPLLAWFRQLCYDSAQVRQIRY